MPFLYINFKTKTMNITVSIWDATTEDEQCVRTFYDLSTDPFTEGMVMYFDFEEYYPVDKTRMLKEGWTEEILQGYMAKQKELRAKYHNKKVRLINRYVSLNCKNPKMNIDYYIEYLDI